MLDLPQSTSDVKRLRTLLDQFCENAPKLFHQLFRLCTESNASKGVSTSAELAKIGMLESDGLGGYRPRYAAYRLRGLWFVTDVPRRPERDSVFPLYPESRFFANRMQVPARSSALDVCTGCGLYAAIAATAANRVTAVDINPRALSFAAYNLLLNGLRDRVDLVQGDLIEPVRGQRFDYISANPPFEPTPPGAFNYLHSDGGQDGLIVVRRLLETLPAALADNGVFEMVSFSLGSSLGWLLTEECPAPEGCHAEIGTVFAPISLAEFAQRFDVSTAADWVNAWRARGLERLGLLYVRAQMRYNTGRSPGWKTREIDDYLLSTGEMDWTFADCSAY